jgi:hypothetical protein
MTVRRLSDNDEPKPKQQPKQDESKDFWNQLSDEDELILDLCLNGITDDERIERLLQVPNLGEWERNFLPSIRRWRQINKSLTDKQNAALRGLELRYNIKYSD